MVGMILDGSLESAAAEHRRLLPLFKALFWVTNPIPIKYAVNRAGFNVGRPRLPMVSLEEADPGMPAKLDAVLDRYAMDLPAEG